MKENWSDFCPPKFVETSTLVEMVVKLMETAEEATTSMEMALGALPRPGRVPEQRLLSPEICRWWRRSCRTLSWKTPTDLGFSVSRLYIGEEAASEVDQGHLTIGPCGLGARHPMASLPSDPPSGSLSVLVLRPGKIGVLVFVSSNSKNISCVAFLKHKNSKK
jgi:hypothetical protein